MLEGYIAYTGGKKQSDCPYPPCSAEERKWLIGWNKGKKENEFFAQLYNYDDIPDNEVIEFDLYPERNYK